MIDKEKVEKYLASGMTETMLQYMAKNYAVNVMILRQLALIFTQQNKGLPLTDEEIADVNEKNKTLRVEAENIALTDFVENLELIKNNAIALALEEDDEVEQ